MCGDRENRSVLAVKKHWFLFEELTKRDFKKKYKRSAYDFERFSVFAVSSIYGVDIMQDNVLACRERLFKLWDKEYKAVCKKDS